MSGVELRVLDDATAVADAGAAVVMQAAAEAREAAAEVSKATADPMEPRGVFRLALAGGSTPRLLYTRLAAALPDGPRGAWEVFLGDERFVPPGHEDSNHRMVVEAFGNLATSRGFRLHRVETEAASAGEAASAYAAELSRTFGCAAGGIPRFDLVLLGLGADGHTASLFAGSSALEAGADEVVVATRVEKLGSWRITLTLPVLAAASRVVFLVCGADKRAALAGVLGADPSLPASKVLAARAAGASHGDRTTLVLADAPAAGRPADLPRGSPHRA